MFKMTSTTFLLKIHYQTKRRNTCHFYAKKGLKNLPLPVKKQEINFKARIVKWKYIVNIASLLFQMVFVRQLCIKLSGFTLKESLSNHSLLNLFHITIISLSSSSVADICVGNNVSPIQFTLA